MLLTGTTGTWGLATLCEPADLADRVSVLALALPTERDRALLAKFADMTTLRWCGAT